MRRKQKRDKLSAEKDAFVICLSEEEEPLKKKRKSIMVLGTGPVLTMTVLFFLLCAVLCACFLMMRRRDPGTAATCLLFGVASGAAGVALLGAYFRHRKEDQEREKAWEALEERWKKK